MTLPVIALDPMVATSHVVRFNENANAMSAVALYAIKRSRTVGLRLTLYGGVFRTAAGVVVIVPEQYLNLTPSATNYVYADTGGVLVKTTTPTPSAGSLLYTLVVGADAITSGTSHVTSRKTQGPQGAQGIAGPAGLDFWSQRNRISEVVGQSANFSGLGEPGFGSPVGFGVNGGLALASTSFYTSVAKMRLMRHTASNFFSGTRGVSIGFRFGVDSDTQFTPTDFRFFVGLYDIAGGTPSIATIAGGGVEVSTFLNIIGIGCDSADANASIIHNDASGTATKVALGSSFPSKAAGLGGTGRIYELTLDWVAGASSVSYSVIEAASGTVVNGTISTDLPALTQGLGFMHFAGGNAALVTTMYCQTIAYTRF